ncbi:MAG: SNF2-related protein [Streptosporangiaceae bacterium]
MQYVVLPDEVWPAIDSTSLVTAAGATSYGRGVQYLREGAVTRMRWDRGLSELHGTVLGSADACYETVAYFQPGGEAVLEFEQGHCSCPVGFDCKHVVALVLAAAQAQLSRTGAQRTAESETKSATWEQSVESWLEPRPASGGGRPSAPVLGIELTLAADAGLGRPRALAEGAPPRPPRLLARLVQPGQKGWVGRSLSWAKLDSQYGYGGWPAPQVQLLQEIHAAYRARSGQPFYYGYGYGDDKLIDLSAFESRQLWPLLDEVAALGLHLVRGRNLGSLDGYRSAELCLDLTRPDPLAPLVITPKIRVDGAPAAITAICFLGTEGHGLVYADRAETRRSDDCTRWRFHLARTVKPVPRQLQQLVLGGEQVEIPAAELTRFQEAYYPRLRAAATVISSDDAFTPPAITGPALLLRAGYTGRHDLDIGWAWNYQVGDSPFRVALQAPAAEAPYRDLTAERAIVASLGLTPGRFGLLRTDPVPGEPQPSLAPLVRLSGLDTMRFSTELLPLLKDHPDVTVEITGDPADYREAGDSLSISVSADEVTDDPDWFDLGITITVAGREVPFADVFVALSRGESYLLLADGAYFSLQKPELQALARLIEEARALHDAPGGASGNALKISRFQAGFWAELTELGVVGRQARRWQQQVSGLLSAEALAAPEPPRTLHAELRPYQEEGFGWLAFLWQHQLGGILADDMGLGKTLQCLALICQAREADPDLPPFLIIAPTSVVSNWAAEAARFAPGLPVVAISGTAARRGQSLEEIAAGAGAVVTSYTLLRMDFAAYSALPWAGLILDEAQNVKNHQSKTYQCARRLPGPVKIGITGTPMENNLMELWSLLSITAPGLFPDPGRFREYYARPIEKDGQADLLAQLRRRIRPLVRRRTKEQVAADLPPKQIQVLEVELHPRHRKLYQTQLQRERQKVLSLIDDLDNNRFTILRSLTLLRQLSLHGALIDDANQDMPCAKIDALVGQLQDVAAGGHRALVFSQFTRFLGKVRERLDTAGIEYCYLDGKTRDRAAEVQRFKDGAAPAFLISLKAGGFGLNLTEADYCFLLDPWWNPATEAQAVDRTHRIGQSRNVMVYRLISAGTIEEKVLALQARKAELFTSVLDSGGVFSGSLDADDIRALFI